MSETIYADQAAGGAPLPEVIAATAQILSAGAGNPSSVHSRGHAQAQLLEDSRVRVAELLGAHPGEIVFTSGGTEGANLAIKGLVLAQSRREVIGSALEHDAVRGSFDYLRRFHDVTVREATPTAEGVITAEAVKDLLSDRCALVSVASSNNELGTVNPIADIARLARKHGALSHTDAVQSAGWFPLNRSALGVDALTLAGHKIGALPGSGVAVIRRGVRYEPLLHGGGQEAGARSGTPSVVAAVGVALALGQWEDARQERVARVRAARDVLIDQIHEHVPGARLTGPRHPRHPAHVSFVFPGVSGELLLLELDARGISASSGSACAAGRSEGSPALLAIGVSESEARSAVRFSFAPDATVETALAVAAAVTSAVASIATRYR
ncbi:MAG: cysteine desulfurase family protein [Mycetocola sp.]